MGRKSAFGKGHAGGRTRWNCAIVTRLRRNMVLAKRQQVMRSEKRDSLQGARTRKPTLSSGPKRMLVFGLVGCLLNRHDPDRREVVWNGHDYVGTCRHCGAPITRLSRRNWRKSTSKA
ncbi:MAG: hypothetical protein ACKO01_00365 [Erythrobacter sp.]